MKELKKWYFIDPWESLKPIKLISSTRNLNVACGEKPRVRLFRDEVWGTLTSRSWEWKLFSPSRNASFMARTCRVKRGDWLNVLLPTPAIHNLSFLATVIILHSAQRWQSGRFVSLETPTDWGWILTCLSRQQSTLLSVNMPFLALSKPFLLYASVCCILRYGFKIP